MSRDRTDEIRNGQAHYNGHGYGGQGAYDQYNPPSFSHGHQGYGQQDYELDTFNPSTVNSFFDEVSSIQESIRKIKNNITNIEELHSRALGTISEDASTKDQLDALTSDTRNLAQQIKNRIRNIEAMNAKLPPTAGDINVRRAQAANLRKKFLETLQEYQQVEYQNRQKYRQRMERQYKIVKPNASQDEIQAALENDEGGQIFAQSLLQSTRYGAAREALREVQERHDDIKKIERTIEELANLFQEMSIIVEAQDVQLEAVETHANQVATDLEQGVVHVDKALDSAQSARRKKWWCFMISIIILIVIAFAVYWFVIRPNQQSKDSKSTA